MSSITSLNPLFDTKRGLYISYHMKYRLYDMNYMKFEQGQPCNGPHPWTVQWSIWKGQNCKYTTNMLNISNSNTKHDFKNEPATFSINFWNTFCIVFSKKWLFLTSKTDPPKLPSISSRKNITISPKIYAGLLLGNRTVMGEQG